MAKGEIAPLNVVHGEKPPKAAVGIVMLGNHHHAGRVLVEPMDDAGPRDPANARETIAAMVEKGVDQGACPIASGRVHDEPSRLIKHHEVLIFEKDLERDVFGLGVRLFDWRRHQRDGLAFDHLVGGVGHRLIGNGEGAFFDERFDLGPRMTRPFGQPAVNALAGAFGHGDDDGILHKRGGANFERFCQMLAAMTDQTPPVPSHAAAKGLALGLGVLLLGGTALLITLLITRGPSGSMEMDSLGLDLADGERIEDVAMEDGQALLLIENERGAQRLMLVDLTTGQGVSVWDETN